MDVIILTKSDKNGGFCVAGINVKDGSFVRLVSNNATSHYSIPQWCLKNVNVLDKINVSVNKAVPSFCQQENIEVQLQEWEKIGSISKMDLWNYVSNKNSYIFGDKYSYLDEKTAQAISYSLMMVKVSNLSITHNDFNKTKASFIYNGKNYSNMAVTDSEYYQYYSDRPIKDAILVVSIPDTGHESIYYSGSRCYKFVSKIFII